MVINLDKNNHTKINHKKEKKKFYDGVTYPPDASARGWGGVYL